jgi:ABC-type sugar transport system ATPase subunit
LGVRPEDVSIVPPDTRTAIQGEVYVVEPLGRDDLLDVQAGGVRIHALADREMKYKLGDKVGLKLDPAKVQFFDPQTENSLLWN